MSTLDTWLADTETALGLPPGSIPDELRRDLLDLTREVAHGVARVAGPLTCYLIGQAVAAGMTPANAVAQIRPLVPQPTAVDDSGS